MISSHTTRKTRQRSCFEDLSLENSIAVEWLAPEVSSSYFTNSFHDFLDAFKLVFDVIFTGGFVHGTSFVFMSHLHQAAWLFGEEVDAKR